MPIPGAHLETLLTPHCYPAAQLDRACAIAHGLARGRFVLVEPPFPIGALDDTQELCIAHQVLFEVGTWCPVCAAMEPPAW